MRVLSVSLLILLAPIASAFGGEQFTCNMMALTESDRAVYQEAAQSLLGAVQEKKELRNGYAFRLAPEMLVTAAQWISFERLCCPFFTFEMDLAKDGGPLWLRITGARGVKAFIRSEFKL
jgi:hypothetical protein